MNTYQQKWQQVQRGEITVQQWQRYCMACLLRAMRANRDVFVRLKNR